MLLLRYRAIQCKIDSNLQIESAGLGGVARGRDPMLAVAQRAVIRTAEWMDRAMQRPTQPHELALLAEQARNHQSQHISSLGNVAPFDAVVDMDSCGRLGKLTGETKALVVGAKVVTAHVDDLAFDAYQAFGNQDDPEVVRAYDDLAMFVAGLVWGRVGQDLHLVS